MSDGINRNRYGKSSLERDWFGSRCGRCHFPDAQHGPRPEDSPLGCGWTLDMVREHRAANPAS